MLTSPFESQKTIQNYLNNTVNFEDADVTPIPGKPQRWYNAVIPVVSLVITI